MLIFNQIYKKFLIQYVLFNLNLYRNLQTPHKNTIFKYLNCPLIKTPINAPVKALINISIKTHIKIYYMCPIKVSI